MAWQAGADDGYELYPEYGDDDAYVPQGRSASPVGSAGGRTSRIGTTEWLQREESKRMAQLRALKTREEEKLAEECTFQPRINQSPANAKRVALPAHERLATSRRATLDRREQEKRAREAEEDASHPFRPMLSTKTQEYASIKRYNTRGDMDRLGERLYQDAKHRETKVNKLAMERAAEELEGMFQPQVRQHHQRGGSVSPDGGGVPSPVGAHEMDEDGLALSGAAHRPLHERLDDIKKAKHAKILELRQKWLQDEDLTFKPRICPRSKSVDARGRVGEDPGASACSRHDLEATNRYDDSYINAPGFVQKAWDAHTRTHRDAHHSGRGDVIHGDNVDEEGRPLHAPAISTRSRALAENNQEYMAYKDFVSRQQYQIQKRDMRLRLMREEAHEQQKPPSGPQRAPEDIDRAVHSMLTRAKEGQERMSRKRQAATKGLFRPRINTNSRSMSRESRQTGGATPRQHATPERGGGEIHRRSNSTPAHADGGWGTAAVPGESPVAHQYRVRSKREADVEKIRQERMEVAMREETHRPCIDKKSRQLAERRRQRLATDAKSCRSDGGASAASIPYSYHNSHRTFERAERIREDRAAEEAKECTFAPRVNKSSRAPDSVPAEQHGRGQPIGGFQQFILRQERARHIHSETQRVQDEMGRGGVKTTAISNAIKRCTADGKRLHTVPEPFNLSDGMGRSVCRDEYTFQPTTNETNRDRLLKRVLEENGDDSYPGREDDDGQYDARRGDYAVYTETRYAAAHDVRADDELLGDLHVDPHARDAHLAGHAERQLHLADFG